MAASSKNSLFNSSQKYTELYSRGELASRRVFGVARSQLCFGYTETLAPLHASHSGGGFSSCSAFENDNTETLENEKDHFKNKGGRPPKAVKKDQLLGVKCTLIERRAIQAKAKSAGLSVSEYLCKIGLTGRVDTRQKALPKQVLRFFGDMHHTAANINQIAKKRNQLDELNAFDRATLKELVPIIKEGVQIIKLYLQ